MSESKRRLDRIFSDAQREIDRIFDESQAEIARRARKALIVTGALSLLWFAVLVALALWGKQ